MASLDLELLLSVVGGLGSWDSDKSVYEKSDDCIDCLKDLQRFLRQDDPLNREAFMHLGKQNIVKSDLIPLILGYVDDLDIVYNALKVATFMTMPIEQESKHQIAQVEIMQSIKEAFVGTEALLLVVGLVEEPLQRHPRMTETDALIVQLVVAFLRNIISIPDKAKGTESSADNRTRMRGQLLQMLAESDVLELLLVLAQHTNQVPLRSEAPLLLEIFYNIFEGIDPKALLLAKSAVGGKTSFNAQGLLQKEQAAIRAKGEKSGVKRLPRFGGVFVQHHGSAVVVLGNNPDKATKLRAFAEKNASKKMDWGEGRARLDKHELQELQRYADQFLENSYGVLMAAMRKELEPGLDVSRCTRDDFLRFVRFARFCTSLVRQRQEADLKQKRDKAKAAKAADLQPDLDADDEEESISPFGCISATMGWETFQMLLVLWQNLIGIPTTASNKDWELQHAVLALLKESFMTLDLAQHVGLPADRKASDRLQRRLFYDDNKDEGILPTLASVIKHFTLRYQPKWHAADVAETLHLTLRMLHRLSNAEHGHFLVKKVVRAHARRRPKERPADEDVPPAVGNAENTSDAANEQTDAAPEEQPDQEKDENQEAGAGSDGEGSRGNPSAAVTRNPDRVDPFEAEIEAEEEEERRNRIVEVKFDWQQRIRQELAHPAIVHFYIWLLQGYATNSDFVNHCILSFLQRLADPTGLNLEVMLYQLRVLTVFHEIMGDASFRRVPSAAPLIHFCAKVTRNFFTRLAPYKAPAIAETGLAEGCANDETVQSGEAQRHELDLEERRAAAHDVCGRLLLVELLFWKGPKQCDDVRNQYHWERHFGGSCEGPGQIDDGLGDDPDEDPGEWTEFQVDHLKDLYQRHGTIDHGILQIVEGLHGEFTDRQVVLKLRQLGYNVQRSISKPEYVPGFAADDEARLESAWERHFNKKGAINKILMDMGAGFKKSQLSRKLKSMGLKRGVLTENQVTKLKAALEEYRGHPDYLLLMSGEMGDGWNSNTVRRQLKKHGLLPGRRTNKFTGDGSDLGGESGSSDESGGSSDDEGSPPLAGSPNEGQNANQGDAVRVSAKKRKKKAKGKRAQKPAKRANIAAWDDDDDSDMDRGALHGVAGSDVANRPREQSDSSSAQEGSDSETDVDSQDGSGADGAPKGRLESHHGGRQDSHRSARTNLSKPDNTAPRTPPVPPTGDEAEALSRGSPSLSQGRLARAEGTPPASRVPSGHGPETLSPSKAPFQAAGGDSGKRAEALRALAAPRAAASERQTDGSIQAGNYPFQHDSPAEPTEEQSLSATRDKGEWKKRKSRALRDDTDEVQEPEVHHTEARQSDESGDERPVQREAGNAKENILGAKQKRPQAGKAGDGRNEGSANRDRAATTSGGFDREAGCADVRGALTVLQAKRAKLGHGGGDAVRMDYDSLPLGDTSNNLEDPTEDFAVRVPTTTDGPAPKRKRLMKRSNGLADVLSDIQNTAITALEDI
eukprot:jgi/Botrbrau1/22603/Bobra.176_1s0033.1